MLISHWISHKDDSTKKYLQIFFLIWLFIPATILSADDLDVYRTNGQKSVMLLVDASSSMSRPVYDSRVDYGAWMKRLVDAGSALDENDCRNGADWWDADDEGNDYDRLPPRHIYLVSTWLDYKRITYRDVQGREKTVTRLEDILTNTGSETDCGVNKRCGLLLNAVTPVKSSKGVIWNLNAPDSIEVDDAGHVVFPGGTNVDLDGRTVTIPTTAVGARLPNGQDILRDDIDDNGGKNFLRLMKKTGVYFTGLFGKAGSDSELTVQSAKAQSDCGGQRVYFFASGNWLNFIKFIEDFQLTPDDRECAVGGAYIHQRFKIWRYACGPGDCGSALCEKGSERQILSRLETVRRAVANLVATSPSEVLWGLARMNSDGDGADILAPLGTPAKDIVEELDSLTAGGESPLGESLQGVYNKQIPLFKGNDETVQCANYHILVLSDGFPTEDTDWGRIDRDTAAPNDSNPEFGGCPDGYGAKSCMVYGDADEWPPDNHADDVSHWLNHAATYPQRVHMLSPGDTDPMLADVAGSGGGLYLTPQDGDMLLEALSRLGAHFTESATLTPPQVSVDQGDRAQHDAFIYLTLFKPEAQAPWKGNLKKYALKWEARSDCGQTQGEWVVSDKDGRAVNDCDGHIAPLALSFWSAGPDGGRVDAGGVGAVLLDAMPEPSAMPPYDFRRIYTCKDPVNSTEIVRFWRDGDPGQSDGITAADLGVASDHERDRIINFVYGYTLDAVDTDGNPATYDEAADGGPVAARPWVLGDILHSEPCVIDYLAPDGTTTHRLIAVGGNDGMLHFFVDDVDDGTEDDTRIDGVSYAPGAEIWAFIPGDLLPELKTAAISGAHSYFVDGFCTLLRSGAWDDADNNGIREPDEYSRKTLIFGERRGGRAYWALDVTSPDPTQWTTIQWRIQGGVTTDFEELGQTWSRPVAARLPTGADDWKDVLIFGGGYDPLEDHFPEPWQDGDSDGRYDPDNPLDGFDTADDRYDVFDNDHYDTFNPDMDAMGRGVFVVDAADGSLIFKAAYGTPGSTVGIRHTFEEMKWCFPADPTVIEDRDTLCIYIADLYGTIWKIDYDRRRTEKWRVRRIFSANPGSDQPNAVAALSLAPSLNTSDRGRKTFYSPDVSWGGTAWTDLPVLYFGTGDREHPRIRPAYQNRFYAVVDTDSQLYETHLINLTCDELDRNADTDQDGVLENQGRTGSDALQQKALIALLYGETPYPEPAGTSICRGWYKILGQQGACTQDIMDHKGEMSTGKPILYNGTVYFSTYQPVYEGACAPMGNTFIYALDYSYGTAAVDLNPENQSPLSEATTGTLEDGFRSLGPVSGLPSAVRVITRRGKTSAFVSAGGRLFGAGTGQVGEDLQGLPMIRPSARIPGPPGGVQQMLWRVQN